MRVLTVKIFMLLDSGGCCKSWSEIVLVQQGAVAFIRGAGVVPRTVPSVRPSASHKISALTSFRQIHILMCSCEQLVTPPLYTFSISTRKSCTLKSPHHAGLSSAFCVTSFGDYGAGVIWGQLLMGSPEILKQSETFLYCFQ